MLLRLTGKKVLAGPVK